MDSLASLVSQLDDPDSEVRLRRACRRLNALGDELREVARQRRVVSLGGVAVQVEADPADDVVLRVRARTGQGVEDREQQDRPEARVERTLDGRRAELRAGVRVVEPEREILVEPAQNPARL